jgi:two-component system, cell cycle sensor histidine kinase and response regulator CckA
MQAQTRGALGQEEFPAATSGEVIGWLSQPDAEPWKGTETILLVEDETFVRQVTAEVLCAAGYGVLTAQNAEEALQMYNRHCGAVDLLLTDLVLPGQTGNALAARLTRLDHRLKVLFVTGYVEQLKTMEEGQECLPKPFSTSALLEKIRQVLDQRGLAAAV